MSSAPSVQDMLADGTFAANIIRRHGTADAIFDGDHMRRLRRFVYDPTPKTQRTIMEEDDILDAPGDEPGTRANRVYGNLSGYIIVRHGTPKQVFSEGDIGALRWWFKEMERAGMSLDETE